MTFKLLRELILSISMLTNPPKEYRVINENSLFHDKVIILRKDNYQMYKSIIKYQYQAEYEYLIFTKDQIEKVKSKGDTINIYL